METLLERNLNYMQASLRGRDELATLLNNLGTDGFTLKLDSFGKFSVRHKAGILRKIPFTGETILTRDRRKVRFVSLGELRQRESVLSVKP